MPEQPAFHVRGRRKHWIWRVQFSGMTPGYVGLWQINVTIPPGTPAGSSVPVRVVINGTPSNTVRWPCDDAMGVRPVARASWCFGGRHRHRPASVRPSRSRAGCIWKALVYIRDTTRPEGWAPSKCPCKIRLGATATVGVAATVGGSKSGEKSSFTWSYSPSYFRLVYSERGNDDRGSLNHRGNLNWTRKLSRKWSMTANAYAFVANFEQLYFNPSTLTSVASMSISFDDLAAGMMKGTFTDAEFHRY